MGLPDLHHYHRKTNGNVLSGRFLRNVRLDLCKSFWMCSISESRELYSAFLVDFVRVRRFVVVMHHSVVDGRLRFLNRFSGLVNRGLVLRGRLRVLGQIRFLDGVLHLRDVLATSISDLRGQLLGKLIHHIQRLDHFERVVGAASRSSPAESPARSPLGLPVGS